MARSFLGKGWRYPVMIDRNGGMAMRNQERDLNDSGDLQRGSNIGRGQVLAADPVEHVLDAPDGERDHEDEQQQVRDNAARESSHL